MAVPRRIDLLNCADEPIHVPGSIQPHGALVFLDSDGRLEGWSANAAEVLGTVLELGRSVDALALPASVTALIEETLDTLHDGEVSPAVAAMRIADTEYDCVVHAHQGRVIIEFEAREESTEAVALFAIKAHGSIERLRRQKNIDGLLRTAVRQVREFTGFDRVMAYRFRADDSGDVVA